MSGADRTILNVGLWDEATSRGSVSKTLDAPRFEATGAPTSSGSAEHTNGADRTHPRGALSLHASVVTFSREFDTEFDVLLEQ